MKFVTLFCILLHFPYLLMAQIYDKPKEFTYSVTYLNTIQVVTSETVTLTCTGNNWKPAAYKEEIKDNWLISWNYVLNGKLMTEHTGVATSAKKVFLHPIRIGKFAVLNYCPFPMVELPLRVGQKWQWNFENINDRYASSSNIKAKINSILFQYQVKEQIEWYFKEKNEVVNCFKIEGIGKTKQGESRLYTYFSIKYGFVYLNFKTLNEDDIQFELQNIK